jgi:hypothetical protein
MIIIGAGMAGLLAGNILRGEDITIFERQQGLPNNHGAVLRFKTKDVSWATGIPFRKVNVMKGICNAGGEISNHADIWSSNRYSIKATGRVMERSILNLDDCVRYIAPPDFTHKMSRGLNIRSGVSINKEDLVNLTRDKVPIISTIPLPQMWTMMREQASSDDFIFKPIMVVTATVSRPECDVFQTLYYPGQHEMIYRASITGNKIIAELAGEYDINPDHIIIKVMQDFGIAGGAIINNVAVKTQMYGKISTPNPGKIKQMIYELSEEFGIYSLGRFACWKHVTMDHLVHDIDFIRQLIESSSSYNAVKRTTR